MLTMVAWKNVWRSKRRSVIMIAAIAVGLWGGLFAVGIFTGMYDTMVSSAIDRQYGHIQLHAKGFRTERLIGMSIPNPDAALQELRAIPGVAGVSGRTVIDAMGSSATSNQGITIIGIVPGDEMTVSSISRRIVEGSFFSATERQPILIGRKLAEKLDLRMRGKIILAFQNIDGTIVYGAFRIAGIFDTEANTFDGVTVFVRQGDLDALTGHHLIHEIAVRLASNDSLMAVEREITQGFPQLDVQTWMSLAPELKLTVQSGDVTMAIFLGVILFALLFGITNTMLMSVLDRTREFGVLMAVGMKRRRIFMMVVLETLFLSLTGGIAGSLLGAGAVILAARRGISLAWFSDGLSQYGISSMLYPAVHASLYPTLALMVVVVACAAAIYPALKAVHLKPASAIAEY